MCGFPVSVKAVLLDADLRVVLLKNERGEWELPGGKLEPGEQPPQAVERELHEELGVRARCGPILDSWVLEVVPGREVLMVTYAAEADSLDALRHSGEHQAVGRFAAAELDALALPEGYRASIRAALHRIRRQAP